MKNRIQVAFDLGSFSIKGAVGRIINDDQIEILSIRSIQTDSIRNGDIVDKEALLHGLEYLIEKMEKDAKINIDDDAWVSVSGKNIKSINSSTRIRSKDNSEFEVNDSTKQKLLTQCSDIQVSSDRYVLHNLERGFFIDGSSLIRNPLGMIGKSIDAKSHVIHIKNFNLSQIDHCFSDDLSIEVNPVFDGLAAASANLNKDDQDLGVMFIDVGADKTNMLLYKDNYLIHSKVIPLGSKSVTKDIAAYLQTSIKQAEKIKHEHVSALSDFADAESNFELSIQNDDLTKSINKQEISKIAELRYEDIIDQIKSEMKLLRIDVADIRSGIKITGGGSNVKNLDLLFKKHFEDTKCEYLPISNIVFKENLEDRRELSTLIGLLSWPIFNVEDSSPTVGIKNFESITKSISSVWKGFFE
ncbi:MAG: cell division protein FtsA [Candidatus Marinimicrobia bacterium]|jgi:cell division protein FtsA|nr:cell division protein FtsA [Candidatus Neomarinimicrobiota bacterium]MBT3944028.1 cell division protein FtsA [Candidatus Neomarinimicrobiota bacterium]MBT4111752.1 cell division protein FtsA [Candidatus Neomarinimicrobiota bacterium]MBT4317249.1 cell division protein FtsA [Candidatus Neomarinimicrobiota bacterium]MBT4706950.1 cell division protein FtsA [Candidatus Neomarinimicrobiota bacterium]